MKILHFVLCIDAKIVDGNAFFGADAIFSGLRKQKIDVYAKFVNRFS